MKPLRIINYRGPSDPARCKQLVRRDARTPDDLIACNRPLEMAFRWVGRPVLMISCPEHGRRDWLPVENEDSGIGL